MVNPSSDPRDHARLAFDREHWAEARAVTARRPEWASWPGWRRDAETLHVLGGMWARAKR
jgi:hypothetical protein